MYGGSAAVFLITDKSVGATIKRQSHFDEYRHPLPSLQTLKLPAKSIIFESPTSFHLNPWLTVSVISHK